LEALRRQLLGERTEFTRTKPVRGGLRVTALCCAALITAWAVALPVLNRADGRAAVPEQTAQDQRYRTEAASERVRRTLGEGIADLTSVARLGAAGGIRTGNVMDTLLPKHPEWSALYLMDGDGEVLLRSGAGKSGVDRKAALGGAKSAKPTVLQLNHGGKVPVSAAVVPFGTGGRRLVGEFEPAAFNGLLTRPGLGKSWLVDAHNRVIGSNQGFIAFSAQPGHQARTLTAAAPVKGAAPVDGLRWRVVTQKPLSWLPLASYETQRRAILVGLLAFTAALLCLGWLQLTVIRPLRAVDRSAAALAAGDRTSVIYPRQHDEVGSLARSLELIRQRLADADRHGAAAERPLSTVLQGN
ncbi:HAMP domain-containing protein, partial [Streptomyces sp. NPDC057654]|uniref:HAMP domain-containing protein n=1 Tax=Streptomyces sp. NPDC057654 TaxID=3346196 RepID=UPI00367DF181